jgi:hypothetical protein
VEVEAISTSTRFSTARTSKGEDMIRAKNSLAVFIVCVTIFACIGILGWGNRGQAFSKVVWEYKVIPMEQSGAEPTLNKLGSDGWEFVQIISNDQINGYGGYFLFKRAK